MKMIRDNPTLPDCPDDNVWDRVRTLAPRSDPVRVGLFRRPGRQAQSDQPAARQVLTVEKSALPNVADNGCPWDRFPIATKRQIPAKNTERWEKPRADSLSFDLLRTRLLQVMQRNDLQTVAITAPSPGCGTTFTATNLALSCARLSACRVLLIDLNFRSPGVADSLNLLPSEAVRQSLLGRVPLTGWLERFGANLLVGTAKETQPDPAELLMDPRSTRTLAGLKKALKPDIILFDLPPMLAYDDTTALLPLVDGVLLVTDGTRTVARQVRQCQDILADQTQLLGIVLNKARRSGAGEIRYADA